MQARAAATAGQAGLLGFGLCPMRRQATCGFRSFSRTQAITQEKASESSRASNEGVDETPFQCGSPGKRPNSEDLAPSARIGSGLEGSRLSNAVTKDCALVLGTGMSSPTPKETSLLWMALPSCSTESTTSSPSPTCSKAAFGYCPQEDPLGN